MKLKFCALALLTALGACSTDVELIAPGDPLPVVYCLLDPEDSIQYVRIGSTYSVYPGDTNFRPDQEEILVDQEMRVYLAIEYTNLQQEITYGYPVNNIQKDSGWFPSSVNQIYAIPCRIQPGARYSLYIHFPATNKIIHGETISVDGNLSVVDPELVPGREATLLNSIDFFVRIHTVTGGPVFQSTMTFRYAEFKNGIWMDQSLVLPQKFIYQYDPMIKYCEQRISGERFLIEVARAIQPEENVRRVPLGLDFHVSLGGEDLALKIRAENNTQSFSILEVNSFDNAIGVFSCLSHSRINNVPISRFTIDTLALGPQTRNLGFLTAAQIDSLHYETH
jgi:hypothetical protein